MFELLSKIILIPIILVILLIMACSLFMLTSTLWRIVIICSSGGWAFFAFPAGILLIIAQSGLLSQHKLLTIAIPTLQVRHCKFSTANMVYPNQTAVHPNQTAFRYSA